MQEAAKVHQEVSDQRVILPAPYTIRNAEVLYDTVREALLNQSQVVLDVSSDADVDLSFLQLVEIARQFAASQNKLLELERPASETIRDKLQVSGFATNADDEFHRFWFHKEAC